MGRICKEKTVCSGRLYKCPLTLDFCPILRHTTIMKNKHLEHPEDSILTGDLSVLDWFLSSSTLSTKVDGAPAIIYGTNPKNGKFFVGTKSVFNKVKIKINHSHEEIEQNHTGAVAEILHHSLDCLPITDSIIQCDFIGFGGEDTFTPNTITYVFDEIVKQDIIVAPHTEYSCQNDLRDAVAHPLTRKLNDTKTCKFVQPRSWQLDEDFDDVINFARQMSQLVDFVDEKTASQLKIDLNKCIRQGIAVNPQTFDNSRLISYWLLIKSIKDDMLHLCRNNGPKAFIGNRQCGGEGYVRSNEFGTLKLVNREKFSYANFNVARSWK